MWYVIYLMYCLIWIANILLRKFASFLCCYLVLELGWYWPHKKFGSLPSLVFSRIVWEGQVLVLVWIFGKIQKWNHLAQGICMPGVFLLFFQFRSLLSNCSCFVLDLDSVFWDCMFPEIFLFHIGCPVPLYIIVQSNILKSVVFLWYWFVTSIYFLILFILVLSLFSWWVCLKVCQFYLYI